MSTKMYRRAIKNLNAVFESEIFEHLKTWPEMENCEAFVMHEEKCLIRVLKSSSFSVMIGTRLLIGKTAKKFLQLL